MKPHSLALTFLALSAWAAEPRPSLAEPSLSPVRAEVAFVSGGDIWTAPLKGGEAQLLVSHPATESRPLWSPDGAKLAFVSTRTGDGDIYVLTLATGALERITYDDGAENLDAWSRDGKWLYFTASKAVQLADLFRVPATGGTPQEVSADQYMTEFQAAPSPDGSTLVFAARGNGSGQWWRRGHSHLDESELWQLTGKDYKRLVEKGAKNMWPMWAADGKTIYFMSDRSGAENLWSWQAGATKQLTKFKDGRLVWPTIAYDGKTIVFERDFGLWQYDVKSGASAEIKITLRGAPAASGVTRLPLSSFGGLALSPDGKKVVVAARGELFAAPSKEGGEAARVTNTPAPEGNAVWAPDSRRIAYLSERGDFEQIYLYDFATRTEKQLTRGTQNDSAPRFSPDGKQIAFVRGRKELRTVEVETGTEKLLATGAIQGNIAWSPDGKWIAYTPAGEKGFRNVWVAPAAGGEAKPISFLANSFTGDPKWSPDGKYLLFNTSQRTEETRVARIDLQPRAPKYREDTFRELFEEKKDEKKDAKPAEKKVVVDIDFDGIRQRLSFVPTGLDAGAAAISPDGKQLLLTAFIAGQQNLYLWPMDELAREATARQLTSTSGGKGSPQWSSDSKEVWYTENGRVSVITAESRQTRSVSINAEMEVAFDQEKLAVFEQAWTTMRDTFYDPAYHGSDWNAVRAKFAPQIAGSKTPDEMRRIISLMLGELNASHSGISAPGGGGGPAVGKLGLRFEAAEYETNGKLKVREVLKLGPADVAKILPGETLESVDGVAVDGKTNLDALLKGKAGKRVELKVSGRAVVVRPVSAMAEGNLRYRQWVEGRRAYVDKISGGKLGYVHMRDMGDASLQQLYIDLDTENQTKAGVVIDIRNNNGGFVNAYALDVFTRRPYLRMEQRGMPQSPARATLGQRALELPTILVINQFSLSDAEDFTEGYRTLKLGKVVGEPTAGWIIYTGGVQLVDGSALRTPMIKVFDHEGKNMELAPRPVDVPVERPVGETLTAKDVQLDTAVRELLNQIRK